VAAEETGATTQLLFESRAVETSRAACDGWPTQCRRICKPGISVLLGVTISGQGAFWWHSRYVSKRSGVRKVAHEHKVDVAVGADGHSAEGRRKAVARVARPWLTLVYA
jgi:hypothetical protein